MEKIRLSNLNLVLNFAAYVALINALSPRGIHLTLELYNLLFLCVYSDLERTKEIKDGIWINLPAVSQNKAGRMA